MHEKLTQSSECRKFNRRTALLLQRLEDARFYRLVDRAMDRLGSCNPKDLLPSSDRVERARDVLQRLRDLAKENPLNE